MNETSTTVSSGSVNITLGISGLRPVYRGADTIRIYIWTPSQVELTSSTDRLFRVAGWVEDCRGGSGNQFQTARVFATARFSSGTNSFSADVLRLVQNRVSSDMLLQ